MCLVMNYKLAGYQTNFATKKGNLKYMFAEKAQKF